MWLRITIHYGSRGQEILGTVAKKIPWNVPPEHKEGGFALRLAKSDEVMNLSSEVVWDTEGEVAVEASFWAGENRELAMVYFRKLFDNEGFSSIDVERGEK